MRIERGATEREQAVQRLQEHLQEIGTRSSRIGPPVPEGRISLRKERGPL